MTRMFSLASGILTFSNRFTRCAVERSSRSSSSTCVRSVLTSASSRAISRSVTTAVSTQSG